MPEAKRGFDALRVKPVTLDARQSFETAGVRVTLLGFEGDSVLLGVASPEPTAIDPRPLPRAARVKTQRRRITLGVGQLVRVGEVAVTLMRDNSNGTVLLDVAGPAVPQIDRERRRKTSLRVRAD